MAQAHSVAVVTATFLQVESLPSALVQILVERLPPTERARIASFRSSNRIRQFVVARELLRALLSWRLGFNPVILTGTNGAPYLASRKIYCSISHSDNAALVGYSENSRIGIDIETLRGRSYERLLREFFHPEEFAEYSTLPPSKRQRWFFNLWTAKEALAKLSGNGITLELLQKKIINKPENIGCVTLEYPLHSATICGESLKSFEHFTCSYDESNYSFIFRSTSDPAISLRA
ncbi:MAG: 4'-phosphopantetheinyl transferase superfamily protein [Gammaproteobacteria bacterium]|nr:4'-phosphopantetheinyl transferase superfamily protein [Gammaproteobacteria bacterium]